MSPPRRFTTLCESLATPHEYHVDVTSDPRARLAAHNDGLSPHTAQHRPWRMLVVIEPFGDRRDPARAVVHERRKRLTTRVTKTIIDPLIVKLDQDGNLVFNRVFGGGATAEAVAIAPDDGSIWVAGTTTSSGAGFQDAFVLHLDSTGKKALDAVTWGGAGFEEGLGIAVAAGTVVLAASTTTAHTLIV